LARTWKEPDNFKVRMNHRHDTGTKVHGERATEGEEYSKKQKGGRKEGINLIPEVQVRLAREMLSATRGGGKGKRAEIRRRGC